MILLRPAIFVALFGFAQSTIIALPHATAQTLEARLNYARLRNLSQSQLSRHQIAHRLVTQTPAATSTSAKAAVVIASPPLSISSAPVSRPRVAPRVVARFQLLPPLSTKVEDQPRIVDRDGRVTILDEPQPRIVERSKEIDDVDLVAAPTEAPVISVAPVASEAPVTSAAPGAPAGTVPESAGPVAGGVESGATNQSSNGVARVSGRKPITVSVDTRLGFDKSNVIISTPAPLGVEVRRRITALSLTASYPLSPRSSFSVSVPFIDQSIDARANGQTLKRRGRGVGDISLFLQRQFPRGNTDFSIAGGLVAPTGRSSFDVRENELPTGNGFYEALLRLSVSTMRVPLRFFGSLDYGKSLARTVQGQRFRAPDSYGGEVGFFYTMGPEFTSQTSVSYAKVTSPFLLDADSSVAYLTQALSYQTATATVVRGSIDLGLTDDSTDAYFNLSFNKEF